MNFRRGVDRSLIRDIKRAQRRKIEAGDRFRRLANGVHGSMPSHNLIAHVRDAGAEYRSALFHLRKTLIRYSKCLAVVNARAALSLRLTDRSVESPATPDRSRPVE